MPKNTEALIQVAICKYLQAQRIYFLSVPNEAAGNNKIRSMQMVSMGLRSGVSDLIVFLPLQTKPDKIIFVEVKAPKGRQSPNQKKFEKKMNEFGYNYFLVYSVGDMKKIVENHIKQYWF